MNINGVEFTVQDIMRACPYGVEICDHDYLDSIDDREYDQIVKDIKDLTVQDSDICKYLLTHDPDLIGNDVVITHTLTESGLDIMIDLDETFERSAMRCRYENERDAHHKAS
jgi:hypothetical protein